MSFEEGVKLVMVKKKSPMSRGWSTISRWWEKGFGGKTLVIAIVSLCILLTQTIYIVMNEGNQISSVDDNGSIKANSYQDEYNSDESANIKLNGEEVSKEDYTDDIQVLVNNLIAEEIEKDPQASNVISFNADSDGDDKYVRLGNLNDNIFYINNVFIKAKYIVHNETYGQTEVDGGLYILLKYDVKEKNIIKSEIALAGLDNQNSEQEIENTMTNSAKYTSKLNSIRTDIEERLNPKYSSGVTSEVQEAANEELKLWDDMLNEIYSVLKDVLDENEMNNLQQAQIEWISYRDLTAEEDSVYIEDETMRTIEYTCSLASLTSVRCYELVEYMR